jgi:hypothetical protein
MPGAVQTIHLFAVPSVSSPKKKYRIRGARQNPRFCIGKVSSRFKMQPLAQRFPAPVVSCKMDRVGSQPAGEDQNGAGLKAFSEQDASCQKLVRCPCKTPLGLQPFDSEASLCRRRSVDYTYGRAMAQLEQEPRA